MVSMRPTKGYTSTKSPTKGYNSTKSPDRHSHSVNSPSTPRSRLVYSPIVLHVNENLNCPPVIASSWKPPEEKHISMTTISDMSNSILSVPFVYDYPFCVFCGNACLQQLTFFSLHLCLFDSVFRRQVQRTVVWPCVSILTGMLDRVVNLKCCLLHSCPLGCCCFFFLNHEQHVVIRSNVDDCLKNITEVLAL